MEIKEEKVTQTVKTYTFTEDEYHELIYKERKYGYTKAVEYIGFCIDNYKYELNSIASIMQFVKDLLEYARHGYKMNNMYDLSFNEWLKENKE